MAGKVWMLSSYKVPSRYFTHDTRDQGAGRPTVLLQPHWHNTTGSDSLSLQTPVARLASPTRCQNISSHTHEYEQAGTRCMSGPCLLLAAWQMGRSEGRARHCPCLPSACFQQHNIPPRPLHKFSAQIFDSDWWICCAWPMTGRDCVRAILRMFEMLCVLTSRWKRDYFVCQKPDIRTCSGGPARHCTDSVE